MKTGKFTAVAIATLFTASGAWAAPPARNPDNSGRQYPVNQAAAPQGVHNDESGDAQQLVKQAVDELGKMKKDPHLNTLLEKAKGVYLVPSFGRGALIVGGRGGSGLVLVRENGNWSGPAFYDIGAISLGPQIGVTAGPVAFLLMDKEAVDKFKGTNKFTLNAEAGLTIVNYSANGQSSWGKGDIVMWSGTGGAYVGATVSASDINWDNKKNEAFYGNNATASEVLAPGKHNPKAQALIDALPREAGR